MFWKMRWRFWQIREQFSFRGAGFPGFQERFVIVMEGTTHGAVAGCLSRRQMGANPCSLRAKHVDNRDDTLASLPMIWSIILMSRKQ